MDQSTGGVHSKESHQHAINWLITTLGIAFALLLYMSADMYISSRQSLDQNNYNLKIEELKGRIIFYDEVLTMSARAASFTGDTSWIVRYNHYVELLDLALADAKLLAPHTYTSQLAEITSKANNQLVAMETKAFTAIDMNDNKRATDIMFSEAYQKQKDIYNNGITHFGIPKQLDLRLSQLKHQIIYLDEVLTMSARMSALTGDLKWEDRYLEHVPILDSALDETKQLLPKQKVTAISSQTADANEKLIEMEMQTFDLIRKGNLSQARKILLGKEYLLQKQRYAKGMNVFSEHLQKIISKTQIQQLEETNIKIGLTFIMILIISIITYIVMRQVRQSEQDLEKHNIDLGRKTEELEAFAYSLSHDLKAPLKTIQGFSKRLEKKLLEDNNSELQVYSAQITKNALRLDGLIQDTLAITQAENLMEDNCKLDLEKILNEIQDQLSEINRENLIQFRFKLNHSESLTSQQTRIRLILANLISNSIKYSKSEGNQQFVEVVTSNKEGNVFEIRVIDNGIGIPIDQQEKVYSMFFRANSSISFGSGLGLHLVRKNVEKLDGKISFNSSKNGTEFIIHLPQAA